MNRPSAFLLIQVILVASAVRAGTAQSYHVTHAFRLGGEGGWDLLTLDTVRHRLFVARQDRVLVVDPETGRIEGEIPGLVRAHGIALAYRSGRGFATSGGDGTVVMFDLATLQVKRRIAAAPDADGILFDPVSGHIFTFNGDAHSFTVIDPDSGAALTTVALPGAPEFGVASGDGMLYVNIEDQGTLVELDSRDNTVRRQWSLAPCTAPTGLAIDRAHHRLFTGCRNGVMAISDASGGRLITTVPIGSGVDACRFDPDRGLAFAANGDGTLSVIREETPDRFTPLAAVPTRRGARTMELDPETRRVYTVTADFGPAPAPSPEHPRPRPSVLPGTLTLLVLEP